MLRTAVESSRKKKKMAKDFQRFCVQETNCFSRIHESSILYKLLPREMCKCKFNSVRCLKKALCEKRDTSKSTHFAITLSVCRCGMLMRFPTCRTNIVSRLAKKGLSEGLHCRPPHVYFSLNLHFLSASTVVMVALFALPLPHLYH